MNKQEIFNKAYLGLASQKFQQSIRYTSRQSSECQYRGSHKRRCAIGWLIPDDLYRPEFEGIGVPVKSKPDPNAQPDRKRAYLKLRETIIKVTNAEGEDDLTFLDRLQAVHDKAKAYKPDDLKDQLTIFARMQGLTVPEIPVRRSRTKKVAK